MQVYFKNVLRDFLPQASEVWLEPKRKTLPDFILTDLNGDDIPELIFAFKQKNRVYTGILTHQKKGWLITHIEEGILESQAGHLLQVLTPLVNETFEIGQIKRFENFLSKDQSTLFALVNNQPYTLHVKLEPKIRQSAEQEVIDFKMADVFGTGHNYYIYLLGSRIYGEVSPYVGKLGLVIKDTNNETVKIIPLEVEEGYKPQLFIGDFTGDKADDVMVSIFTKSSLDAAASYIYHIEGEQVKLILNTPQLLNNESTQVIYQDQYKVEVLPALTQKVYPLDMSHKSESYLDELYDLEGHLLHKYTGQIEEAMTIVPLDYDGNQVYYVLIIQRIMGISSEDFLGTVETILKWQPDIKAFIPTSQYVAIYGQDKITE